MYMTEMIAWEDSDAVKSKLENICKMYSTAAGSGVPSIKVSYY